MVKLMALELKLDLDINSITEEITNEEALYLNRNRKLLEILSENFSLGIISNFSGNLDIILDEFKLTPYFKFVIDSYHTPYTKPQFEIFKLALDKTKTPANQCLYIGDNPSRDSGPAKKMGMKGICIKDVKSKKEFDQSSYDMMIFSLEDLISLIEKK
jgi:putative hydrolase of the HAD superfamily